MDPHIRIFSIEKRILKYNWGSTNRDELCILLIRFLSFYRFIVYRTLNVTTGGSPVNGIGELTNGLSADIWLIMALFICSLISYGGSVYI